MIQNMFEFLPSGELGAGGASTRIQGSAHVPEAIYDTPRPVTLRLSNGTTNNDNSVSSVVPTPPSVPPRDSTRKPVPRPKPSVTGSTRKPEVEADVNRWALLLA